MDNIKELKKIRLNTNNEWYFVHFLKLICNGEYIESQKLRSSLLKILYSRHEVTARLTDDKIIKLNDTLYTYSIQFAILFNLIETSYKNYILPNNFTNILTENYKGEIFNKNSSEFISKILLFSDLFNNWRMLEFIHKKSNCKLLDIIKQIFQYINVRDQYTKSMFVEGIESILNFYKKFNLVNYVDSCYLLNNKTVEEISKKKFWVTYEALVKVFNWSTLIGAYDDLCKNFGKDRMPIFFLISRLSVLLNTPTVNVVRIFKNIPGSFKERKIYLIQGRTTGSDSFKISGSIYNSIEIL